MINRFSHFLRFNLNVFGLSTISWMIFCTLYLNQPVAGTYLASLIAGGSLLMIACLQLIGYFENSRVLPRKSDLILVGLASFMSAVILHESLEIFHQVLPFAVLSLWVSAPLITVAVFGIFYFFEWRRARSGGRRKRIVFDVLPHEVEELKLAYQAMNYASCVEFLSPEDLKRALLKKEESTIDLVVISRGAVRDFEAGVYLARTHLAGIPIRDRKQVISDLTGRISLKEIDPWSYLVTATRQTPLLRSYAQAKLVLEPILAFALFILLSPLMLLVALAIKLTSPGPVLYRQVRSGYHGAPFNLIKFRSMRTDSEANGPRWCGEADSRITRIGKILRATRIDELPQLWNVMCGQMSFVGPRPERPEFCALLQETIPLFSMRTIIRPGITGWAQTCAGYAASIEESRIKLEYDLHYIKHVSLRLDLIVLIKTIQVALLGSERARTVPAKAMPLARPAPEPTQSIS